MKSWAGNPFKFECLNLIKDNFFERGFNSMSPDKTKTYFRYKMVLFTEVVNSLGVVLKMPRNKEIKRAKSKEDVIKVKHQGIWIGMADMYLSLWILNFCLYYHILKLHVGTFLGNNFFSIGMDTISVWIFLWYLCS